MEICGVTFCTVVLGRNLLLGAGSSKSLFACFLLVHHSSMLHCKNANNHF